ncbi:GNAT family N-acetyltransferase [Paenibacillus marinisediminis]
MLNELDLDIIQDIQQLERCCQAIDPSVRLTLDNSLNIDKRIPSYYLYYEQQQLVSFIKLFIPTMEEAEVTGCTLPDYRQQGYFSSLLTTTSEQLSLYRIPSLLLVCDSQAAPAKQVMSRLPAAYQFTEYSLKYKGERISSNSLSPHTVRLKVASEEDLNSIIHLSSTIFEESIESAASFITNTMKAANRTQYAIMHGDQHAGIVSITYVEQSASINGFGIDPTLQGKGLGRAALQEVIRELMSRNISDIVLDVNSANERAYRLYISAGFQVVSATDYYRMPV